MGATPARQFPAPGSYAMDNENIVQPQDPTPIVPQQQFVSMNAYDGTGTSAPVTPTKAIGNGRGRNKFFGDDLDPELYGKKKQGGGLPTPIIPPPVKKPHDNGF